jgi:hypothetical protein
MRTLAAALLATAFVAPLGAASVKDGVDAWQRGDFTSAVAIWRPLANAGDPDAAFDLGQAYKLGRGVPADLAKARDLYGKAANAGHGEGAANYGLLLFRTGQRAAAMPWIMKASEAGDPRAQYVYATALFNGDFVPRNWPKAYALMSRAAGAGLPQATTNLAIIDEAVSADERRKGIELAQQIESLPLPAINHRLVMNVPAGSDPRDVSTAELGAPAIVRPAPTRPAPPPPANPASGEPAPHLLMFAAKAGRWQVQLGAYGSRSGAKAAWTMINGKAPSLRKLTPSYGKAGVLVRLRAGPLTDHGSAQQACAVIRSTGSACFPVAP